MPTVLIIVILIAILWNVLAYAGVYCIWRRDCKEIGIDNLAVSLKERMTGVFYFVTLPCIIGFIVGMKK